MYIQVQEATYPFIAQTDAVLHFIQFKHVLVGITAIPYCCKTLRAERPLRTMDLHVSCGRL